jgi:hypothetical protein
MTRHKYFRAATAYLRRGAVQTVHISSLRIQAGVLSIIYIRQNNTRRDLFFGPYYIAIEVLLWFDANILE